MISSLTQSGICEPMSRLTVVFANDYPHPR